MTKLRFAALVLFLIAGSGSPLPAQQPLTFEFEKTIPQLRQPMHPSPPSPIQAENSEKATGSDWNRSC
jgi:hypothetical protein